MSMLQYDVELYQRIEHLIGKKLPLYKTEDQEVMCLQERVEEARRVAKMVRNSVTILLIICYFLLFKLIFSPRYACFAMDVNIHTV